MKTHVYKATRLYLGCCAAVLLLLGCDESEGQAPENTSVNTPAAEDAAQPAPADGAGLSVSGAYLRQPAPGQKMLAAFVEFRNDSSHAYTVNHARSPRAEAVEIHRTLYSDGVMSMRRVNHLVVPPKSKVVFKPGGYHLMLSGVEGELKPGDVLPLEFMFEGGAQLKVDARVRAIR